MRFQETDLADVQTIELEFMEDERGWFARTYCRESFVEHGIDIGVVQANSSFNRRAGTLRGMHYQADPHAEAKVVACPRGAIYDVVVDIRDGAETRGQWLAVELTAANRRMLYIPKGFAHGFQTLEDDTEVTYLMSHEYVAASARGVRWDDPAFGIAWPAADERVISDRDRGYPDFAP